MDFKEKLKSILDEGAITGENVDSLVELFNKTLVAQKLELTEAFEAEKAAILDESKQAIAEAFESGQDRVEDLVEMHVETLLKEHAESFVKQDLFEKVTAAFDSIKSAFEKHGFVLNENAKVEELQEKLDASDSMYKDLYESYQELKEEKELLKAEAETALQAVMVVEKTQGLAETTKERIRKLAESVTVDSMDEFATALDLIIEQAKDKDKQEECEKDKKDEDLDGDDADGLEDDDKEDKEDKDKEDKDVDESLKYVPLAYQDSEQRVGYWKKVFAG